MMHMSIHPLANSRQSRYYYPHFNDEVTETQKVNYKAQINRGNKRQIGSLIQDYLTSTYLFFPLWHLVFNIYLLLTFTLWLNNKLGAYYPKKLGSSAQDCCLHSYKTNESQG